MEEEDRYHPITERRQKAHICDRHDSVIDALKEGNQNLAALKEWRQNVTESQIRMEEKLDAMAEKQIEYIEEVAQLKHIVTNGLSHNVLAIRENIDRVCKDYEKRLMDLESFGWFRNKMTFLRDYAFWVLLGGGFFGGVIYMILNHQATVVKKIIGQ